MNINQVLAAIALLVLTGAIGIAAYGLRYTPIQSDAVLGSVLVWDRWERTVCTMDLRYGLPVDCTHRMSR